MPETVAATTPTPAPAPSPAAEAAQAAVSGAAPVPEHPAGHRYDFAAINASHNMPYSAIEWVHGHPALILNAADYAQANFGHLSESPEFATADGARYTEWAAQVVARKGKDYHGPETAELAKAMTVARDEAWFGALPQGLSFFNHQTFWSTVALSVTALILLVFARRKPEQHKPANRFQHIVESLVLFVRDDIVRPNIKHHPDAWVPYFASYFLALLVCNLFGLIPLFGTATGNIGVTAAFSLTTAFLMLFMGLKENGPVLFFIRLVPVHWSWNPGAMLLWFFLLFTEVLQLVIRPLVLAIRLFANMLAGHSVLLVFVSLGFIIYASAPHGEHGSLAMSGAMGVFGWLMTVAFYALELLVALLQAYIFVLLSAVFIGICAHPEH